ncbi:hypothetical protein LZ30DRAFT_115482 [Colletotrichum cereale]|nr:hypothetical protein LZ30DRAFT_115482 [Colletotrichum cereale]
MRCKTRREKRPFVEPFVVIPGGDPVYISIAISPVPSAGCVGEEGIFSYLVEAGRERERDANFTIRTQTGRALSLEWTTSRLVSAECMSVSLDADRPRPWSIPSDDRTDGEGGDSNLSIRPASLPAPAHAAWEAGGGGGGGRGLQRGSAALSGGSWSLDGVWVM